MAGTSDEPLDRGTLIALVAMSLGVFLVANDFTALSVALPDIERDFDSDLGAVQWVINGYALVFLGPRGTDGGPLATLRRHECRRLHRQGPIRAREAG